MSHTEKDCANVTDEDREVGYGWGMDVRASPRKGFNRNKEEIDALKLKKNLFVSKPKKLHLDPIATAPSPSVYLDDSSENGNVGVGGSKILCLSEGSSGVVSGMEQSLELFKDSDSRIEHGEGGSVLYPDLNNAAGVLVDLGTHVSTHGPIPSNVNPIKGDVVVCSENNSEVGCPTFQMGKGSSNPKKQVKIKRKKLNGGNSQKPPLGITCVATTQSVDVSPYMDHAVKRKSWDTDVVMQDTEGVLRRTCVGNEVSVSFVESSFDTVAGVGEAQPREQK